MSMGPQGFSHGCGSVQLELGYNAVGKGSMQSGASFPLPPAGHSAALLLCARISLPQHFAAPDLIPEPLSFFLVVDFLLSQLSCGFGLCQFFLLVVILKLLCKRQFRRLPRPPSWFSLQYS
uniref:Uncharacterized protein n=1 Tax=Pipistrellus kuhlii TaxID=59472 RepID=A0A7J8B218_PIPKU|nr:hypothetical protein mPipKuh1_007762 [Pipistrellus kuhlii]